MKSVEAFEREEKLISNNRRARHDYYVIQTLEAGIMLNGSEVKSMRAGKVSLQDSYAGFKSHNDDELFLFNLHISEYTQSSYQNHEPKRPRKLLVNKKEAFKLRTQVNAKGVTLIPLSLYFSGPFVKVEIGLCKSKRKYDKRETTKKRETEREIQRKFRY